jgi:hypothetical protein
LTRTSTRTALALGALGALGAVGAVELSGCGGASPASGVTAYLRVASAQFEPGELDTTMAGNMEPTVDSIGAKATTVFPGSEGHSLTGSVNGAGAAILIGLSGDVGHWLIPLGIPDLDHVGNLAFSTSFSLSPITPLGAHDLVLRGVDKTGEVGPAQRLELMVAPQAPMGKLVIQLQWDTEADLDLHVRVPNPADPTMPVDVWDKAPLALPPVSSSDPPYSAADVAAAGKLLFDSNANCVIDGQNHEEVVFPGAYPAGKYEVRVDTFSLCGEATARWRVSAFTDTGTILEQASGQSLDRDTVVVHNATAGALAFTFTPP